MINFFQDEIYDTKDVGLVCCNTENFHIILANTIFWDYADQESHTESLTTCFKDFSIDGLKEKLEKLSSYSCLVYSNDGQYCFDIVISKREKQQHEFLFIECFKRDHLPEMVHEENKFANILATTDKTYFLVNNECIVEDIFNSNVTPSLNKNYTGKHVSYIFNLSEKESSDLNFSFQLLENSMLEWEDFESLSNGHMNVENFIYDIQFKQYKSTNKDELKVLLCVQDISEEIANQKLLEENNILQKMIYSIMSDQESFIRFLSECDKIIHTIMHELELEELNVTHINELFRAVHTIRGNASAFEMVKVSKAATDTEEFLRTLRASDTVVSDENLEKLRDGTLNLIDIFNETRNQLSKALGSVFDDWEAGNIKIQKDKIAHLVYLIENDPILKKHKKLTDTIRSFSHKPIKTLFDRYNKLINKVADQCEKKIHPLEIIGGDITVNTELYSPFSESLVHVFRNAIDHGIEHPKDRVDVGKDEFGRIKISVLQDPEYISLIIEDDGNGINPSIIRRIAEEKQLITVSEIEQFSDEEVIDLIFAPGFSTSEEVSDISGNGVGMDAVRASVHDLGGEITVISKMGIGTKFYIDIPN